MNEPRDLPFNRSLLLHWEAFSWARLCGLHGPPFAIVGLIFVGLLQDGTAYRGVVRVNPHYRSEVSFLEILSLERQHQGTYPGIIMLFGSPFLAVHAWDLEVP